MCGSISAPRQTRQVCFRAPGVHFFFPIDFILAVILLIVPLLPTTCCAHIPDLLRLVIFKNSFNSFLLLIPTAYSHLSSLSDLLHNPIQFMP